MAFSKLKAHLRGIGARSFAGLFYPLSEICNLYKPEECWNYFCEAGYAYYVNWKRFNIGCIAAWKRKTPVLSKAAKQYFH